MCSTVIMEASQRWLKDEGGGFLVNPRESVLPTEALKKRGI